MNDRVPPIFCDHADKYVRSEDIKSTIVHAKVLREEACCYSNLSIPSIKQYKDNQMCSNSGHLFVHMFVAEWTISVRFW